MSSAILWDNDGVLVDTEGLYFRATREVLATAGVELTVDLYREISLRRGESAFDLAAARGLNGDAIGRLRARRDALYLASLEDGVKVIEGVEEVLGTLHGRVPMGIVTSARRENFEAMHRHTGLLPYFDFVLTREAYARSKPWPDPYLEALSRHGLVASRCLVVEDTERGLRSARAAGIRCLVVPNSLTVGGGFEGAEAVLGDAREIPRLVEGLLSQ